ncbi:hypothetical protein BSKO_04461 [Bryopsis sp. KO-2023]|nr:hypothetical protein BSKO_04461 [Bryopsis sp. KO-2023]
MAYRNTVQKNFEEREYRHVAVVRHKGTVVSFALGANRRFYYAVLDQDTEDAKVHGDTGSTSLDVFGWPTQPTELTFPGEKAKAGNSASQPAQIPFVELDSKKEIDVTDQEGKLKDTFLSSTARLTAIAPFQVLSDGKYIYLFRQSVPKEHPDALFITTKGEASAAPDAAYEKSKSIPLVDEAILVDRFVLSEDGVVGKKEVRYRRSRRRYQPADSKDSLGAMDMDKKTFYEPTTELDFFQSVELGRFVVLLLPTAIAELYRWQFYVVNKLTGLMEGHSVERAEDGLFNTDGTTLQAWAEHGGVVERAPGKGPVDGKGDLVSEGGTEGSAHSAVALGGKDVRVAIRDKFYKSTREISDITVAAWVKLSNEQAMHADDAQLESWEMVRLPGGPLDTPSQNNDLNTLLSFDAKSYYSVGVENGTVVWSTASVSWRYDTHHVMRGRTKINDGSWHHVAVTYESGTGRKAIVVDGKVDNDQTAVHGGELLGRGGNRFGFIGVESNASTFDGEKGGAPFRGVVDEVSIWKVALSSDVIDGTKFKRLTGTETGLEALWHFDEESGSVVREQTGKTTFHADIKPEGANVWVVSDAPIGELSGIRRNMFEAEGFKFASGPSATLYYQQESAASGYEGSGTKPVKTSARVMLAVALESENTTKMGVIDMGVSALGETAVPPTAFQLQSIKNPVDNQILENLRKKISDQWKEVGDQAFGTMAWVPRMMGAESKMVMHVESAVELLKTKGLEFSATISLDDMEQNSGPLVTLKLGSNYVITIEMHFDTFKAVVSHAIRDGNGGKAMDLCPPITDRRKQREWYRLFVAVSPLTSYVEIRLHDFDTVRIGIKAEDFGFPEWTVGGFKGRIADARIYTRNPIDANSTTPPFGSIFVKNKHSTSYSKPPDSDVPNIKEMYESGHQLGTVHTHGEILWGITGSKPEYDDMYDYIATYEAQIDFKQTTMFPIKSRYRGLSFVGGHLAFADVFSKTPPTNADTGNTTGGPFLFSSADGTVRMYWRGPDRYFFGAEYDPKGSKAIYSVETSTGINVDFRARHLEAGEHSEVSIENGSSGEFCDLTVKDSSLDIHETWKDMPRDLTACAKILEGGVVQVYVGKLLSEKPGELEFKGRPQSVLRKGYTLIQGLLRVKIAVDPHPSDTKVSVNSLTKLGFKEGEPVHALVYDYETDAHPASIFASLAGGSHAITMPIRKKGMLKNGNYKAEGGSPPQWVLRNSVYSFPWGQMYAYGKKAENSKGWSTEGDMCMEAWIKPNLSEEALLLSNMDVSGSTYSMGVSPEEALGFDGVNSYVNVGGSVNAAFEDGITIEGWVNFDEFQHNSSIIDMANLTGSDGVVLGNVGKSDLLRFTCRQGGKDVVSVDLLHLNDWKGKWLHIAVVYDHINSKEGVCQLHVNGFTVPAVNVRVCGKIPKVKWASTFLGRSNLNGNELFKGAMDEIRLWSVPRTTAEINGLREERVQHHRDLVQVWRANDSQLVAGIQANSPSWSFFASAGGVQRRAYQVTPGEQWTHVAASYKQSYACGFDGTDSYAVCQSPPEHSQDMTLEVFFQLDEVNREHGLISKGKWNHPDKIGVDFALYVESNNRLMYVSQESGTDSMFMFDTQFDVQQGMFYRIAITREANVSNGTRDLKYNFFYDGMKVASTEAPDLPGGSKNSPIEFGRFLMDGQGKYLHGSISEIRIWNAGLGANMVGKPIPPNAANLALWLKMEEGNGKIAHDSVGSNHASLRSVKWVRNPDYDASTVEMFINGNKQQVTEQGEVETAEGFFLGKEYSGDMQEVRIWDTARTQEQIVDNMFTRLKGESESLVAYYQGPNVSATEFRDIGLRGNDLDVVREPSAEILHDFSNCPVGDDIVEVQPAARLILGSRAKNHFVEGIDSRPCVAEYGDLQANGVHLFGVHKRCYATIKEGVWQLYTGFKVGNLKTEWVGQSQGHPDVVGFVEGAPPVPSENLTNVGSDYTGASSVALNEPSEVNHIYASSKEPGHDKCLEASASNADDVSNEAGLSVGAYADEYTMEPCDSAVQEAQVSFGRNTTKVGEMRLTGAWEPEHSAKIMDVGRRFIPRNTGVVVVESNTTDIYALRLEHNNALVAYRRLPNTEIPKDRSFLHFPINRQYTKLGTLDGKVGLQADKDYEHASAGGEWSHFKPKESARLKKRIHRQKAELELQYHEGESSQPNSLKPSLGRNIVNTYTWTAAGGFLAEATEVIDSRVESISGTCSMETTGGVSGSSGAVFGEAMALEAKNLDAMEGGQLVTMKAKAKNATFGASLDVVIAGDQDVVKGADPTGIREYLGDIVDNDLSDESHDNPTLNPGKVDAYRFNTFYLEASKENAEDFFSRVVDPTWLDQSPSANAQILRSAMCKPMYAWRIMHRVTFVSRVLPEAHSRRVANRIDGALRAENVESNWELMKRLKPYVFHKSASPADFDLAVRDALDLHMPRLMPYYPQVLEHCRVYFEVEG